MKNKSNDCIYCYAFKRVLHSEVAHIYMVQLDTEFEETSDEKVYECAACSRQWRFHNNEKVKWSELAGGERSISAEEREHDKAVIVRHN